MKRSETQRALEAREGGFPLVLPSPEEQGGVICAACLGRNSFVLTVITAGAGKRIASLECSECGQIVTLTPGADHGNS
jgi:hypothetical protein